MYDRAVTPSQSGFGLRARAGAVRRRQSVVRPGRRDQPCLRLRRRAESRSTRASKASHGRCLQRTQRKVTNHSKYQRQLNEV